MGRRSPERISEMKGSRRAACIVGEHFAIERDLALDATLRHRDRAGAVADCGPRRPAACSGRCRRRRLRERGYRRFGARHGSRRLGTVAQPALRPLSRPRSHWRRQAPIRRDWRQTSRPSPALACSRRSRAAGRRDGCGADVDAWRTARPVRRRRCSASPLSARSTQLPRVHCSLLRRR